MSEMTWTTMHIGGSLSANMLDELRNRIDEDFCEMSADTDPETAAKENRSLLLQGSVNYANPDAVIAFCVDHGLTYHIHFDAGYEFESGIQIWSPGMDKADECPAGSQTYEPMIHLSSIIDDRDQGRSVEQIVERLERFSTKKVPPLTIGPDHQEADEEDPASSPATDMARG